MKPTTFAIATLLGTTSQVHGNFHVGRILQTGTSNVYHRACSSSQYGCFCFTGGGGGRGALLPSGLCGAPLLDFYKRLDGSWQFYHNNGDGQVKGICYTNSAAKVTCFTGPLSALEYEDKSVCYSSTCS